MIAALDTDYQDSRGQCACVLFERWDAESPYKLYRAVLEPVAPYEPGAFYRRELPCIQHALRLVLEPLDVIVVDGYVWLGENRGGLGWHLYEALGRRVPVIGVAKTTFHGAKTLALPLLRGDSHNPLWITAAGMDPETARDCIARMAGPYRVPTLLKAADAACREWEDEKI